MSKKQKSEKDEKPKKEKKVKESETKVAEKVLKAPKSPKVAKPRTPKTAAVELVISNDDIAKRAYYIAEHRSHHGLPGDEVSDWVEAERQLRKEATADKKKKK
jgi:hypothetical protein